MHQNSSGAQGARCGNFVTRTLADYHVPVNLDIGDIEVVFVSHDTFVAAFTTWADAGGPCPAG